MKKIMGNNFSKELKYPIKIYRLFENTRYEIQFSKGIELKKIITGLAALFILMILMAISIRVGSTQTLIFIFNNWMVMLFGGVTVTLIIVFSLNYDYKPIPDYFKDRYRFYKNKNKSFEHYIEVDKNFDKELKYEAFLRSDE